MIYSLTLTHTANGDIQTPHGYWSDESRPTEPVTFLCGSIEQCQQSATAWAERWDLGAGNYCPAIVTTTAGEPVGSISYNGRFWPANA